MRIEDCVAIVTGAGSGLGRATASRLVERGAGVVIADLPTSKGSEVAAELGAKAHFAPTDVTDEDSVSAALDAASALGELRIVVNCAGIAPPGRILGRQGPLAISAFRSVIDVNLIGTFNVMRLAAQAIAAQPVVDGERGVVVCTASIAAFEGQVGQIAYAASKAGVAGMTICAARDLAASYIRVVTIAPGIFQTAMLAGLPEATQTSLGEQVPHPSRLGQPQEFAALVQAIVENPMLNGEVIRLDGALRMAPR